jgi:hypothetical protein
MKPEVKVLELLVGAYVQSDLIGGRFTRMPDELMVLADFLEVTGHAYHTDVRELVQAAPSLPPEGWPWRLASGAWWHVTVVPESSVRSIERGPYVYRVTWSPDAETVQGQAVAAIIPPAVGFSSAFPLDDVPRRFERIRRPSGSGVAGSHHGRSGGRTELPGARLAHAGRTARSCSRSHATRRWCGRSGTSRPSATARRRPRCWTSRATCCAEGRLTRPVRGSPAAAPASRPLGAAGLGHRLGRGSGHRRGR